MLRAFYVAVFTALVALSTAVVSAEELKEEESFSERPDRGWHWYDLPPEIVEAIEDEIERQVEVQVMKAMQDMQEAEAPEPGSSQWISENLPKFRARAADNPTSDNVRALLYLEKILRDRAGVLGRRARQIQQSDPFLDNSDQAVTNINHARARRVQNRQAERLFLDETSDDIVLWVFVEQNCPTCEQQQRILERMSARHGTQVLFVLPDEEMPMPESSDPEIAAELWDSTVDNGHSAMLNILNFPTVYAYSYDSNEYTLISQGPITSDALRERILVAADYAGWGDQELIAETRFRYDNKNIGLLDFSGANGDLTDAEAFIDYITEQIEVVNYD